MDSETPSAADSQTWRSAQIDDPSQPAAVLDVAFGDQGFTAVGHRPDGLAIWTASSAGSDWSTVPARSIEAADKRVFELVIASRPGAFAIIAQDQTESPFSLTAWLSTDGSRWESIGSPAFKSPDALYVADMIWAGNRFVAVGTAPHDGQGISDALVLLSPDGRVWTRSHDQGLTSTGALDMHAVTTFRDQLVAIGHVNFEGSEARTSTDGGVTWALSQPDAFADATVMSATESTAGLFLGGCTDGVRDKTHRFQAAVWLAPSGLDGSVNQFGLGDTRKPSCVSSVTSSSRGLTAVGYEGDQIAIWASVDGVDWSQSPVIGVESWTSAKLTVITSGPIRSVAVGGGTFERDSNPLADDHPIILAND